LSREDQSPPAPAETGGPEPIIGIDMGMTSVIAAWVPTTGEPPEVIPAERGQPALAASVTFREGGAPVVGRAAQDALTTDPQHTVTGVKRLLGRKIGSQAVKDLNARVGFAIVEGEDGDASIEIRGRRYTPAEIAGLLLAQARKFARTTTGRAVKRCVIAVPAYFSNVQKDAVREAGRIAGLEVVKLVHEPTAVALAYGYNKTGDARIVIIDMGGVRLDVSVMEITGNVFDVVATGGDAYLGGANLDARLTEWILASVQKKYGRDLRGEPTLLMKVRTAAEQAKRELSRFRAVDLQIPLAVGAKGADIAQIRLTREVVEQLGEDIAQRVVGLVDHVLSERGLVPEDVDDVILVGGATRTPLLRNRITQAFGKEPRSSLAPEEVIALGAALLADSLSRANAAAVDVVRVPIGIALSDGRYMKIIDKDSRLPITRRVMIPTTRDNQRSVEVDLFEGEGPDIMEVDYLGTVVFPDVPEAKAGDSKLVVDLVLDVQRVLAVTSPEDGRVGERFEFRTREHAQRVQDPDAPTPELRVARAPTA
jgi:molecular chaperone DnaK